MFVKVKNIKGTSNRKPDGYNSWEEFWVAKSGLPWPQSCKAYNCHNKAEVGAHVIQVEGSSKWYIVPLCKACNAYNGVFYVDSIYLVELR